MGKHRQAGRRNSRRGKDKTEEINPETRADDIFEVEEVEAEEDLGAGRRFDNVKDNKEYELPSDFEDEEIDEEEAFNSEDERRYGHIFSKPYSEGESDDESDGESSEGGQSMERAMDALESGEEDWPEDDLDAPEEYGRDTDGPYQHEVQDVVTVEDADVVDDLDDKEQDDAELRKGHEGTEVVMEAFPESLYNLPVKGESLSVDDLIAGLGGARAKLGPARKSLEKMAKRSAPLQAPLPGPIQERQERKAAYDVSKKDIQKWMPLVKSHREAPTLRLTADKDAVPRMNSIAAISSKHVPETKMESEVAALLEAAGASSAAAITESEDALAMKMLSPEEAKARKDQLARMRALLFYHEVKAKRLKKIKSKEYRRKLKKSRKRKQEELEEMTLMDEDEIRQQREEAEYERAKERLTLKHKNTSRFIRRAIKRGSSHAPDESIREVIAEQLRIGEEIRKRVNNVPGSRSSSDEGSSSDEESDEERERVRSMKLKAVADEIVEDEGPGAENGLFSLPFMKRALDKKQQAARDEAHAVLNGEVVDPTKSGRSKFGFQANPSKVKNVQDSLDSSSDEDEDIEAKAKRLSDRLAGRVVSQKDDENMIKLVDKNEKEEIEVDTEVVWTKETKVSIAGVSVAHSQSDHQHITQKKAKESDFIASKNFKGSQNGYIYTKGSKGIGYYKETNEKKDKHKDTSQNKHTASGTHQSKDVEDGLQPLLNGNAVSQEDLIKKAFAGDDVVEEFRKSKREEIDGELPKEELPGELPGWGTWGSQTKEPRWLQQAKQKAESRRKQAERSRKDSNLQYVVISEKWDTRSAKYKTPSIPYPYDSKETYERAMRQPLGRDFNTVESFKNLTRPSIIKDNGVIIEPLKYNAIVGKHNLDHTPSMRPGILTVSGGSSHRAKKVKS
eukprot:jgi/Picsp_1/6650/NSC_03993-R1_protein